MNNQNMGQETPPPAGVPGGNFLSGAKGMFDNLKTPVFWVAIGFVICKVMDRKKIVKL